MLIAASALTIGSVDASAPQVGALICQYPMSSVGLTAYWLPPDSAIAISAAVNASADEPPASSQSCSRPEQPSVPLRSLESLVLVEVPLLAPVLAEAVLPDPVLAAPVL